MTASGPGRSAKLLVSMTQKLRVLALSAAALALLARPVAGQSLAEIAKKEEERRKAAKSAASAKTGKDKPAKTFTNKDLAPSDSAAAPTADPATSASSSAPSAPGAPGTQDHKQPGHSHESNVKPQTPDQPKPQVPADEKGAAPAAGDEKFWRGRVDAARGELQRQELFLEALQSRVNALTTDFVNRDDPAQRATIAADRQKALAEMEAVRKEIDRAKKQIADIEEEARKAGVPPGWLR
jgi:hypothetical protein